MYTDDPLSPNSLSAIPQLEERDLLLVLQSFLHHQKGKYRAQRQPWLSNGDFARLSWQQYGCPPEESTAAYAAFCAMFGVKLSPHAFHASFEEIAAEAYELWKLQGRNITFHTSGSTGVPKACIHNENFLRQEMADFLPLLTRLTPRKRALITVPLHHLFGFSFGLLLPKTLGLPFCIEAPLPTAIAHQMRPHDLVVGIPMLWAKLAELRHLSCTDCLLLSSTAPLPDAIFDKLCGSGFQCLEIFGSSETGAMGFRCQGHTPFSLFPRFTTIMNMGTRLMQCKLPGGMLYSMCFQDEHIWHDDRHFTPQGRKDHAVQVGGVNVYPAHVEKVLAAHPCVQACTVRLMRPDEGQRLKAFVVPVDGYSPQEIRKQLRAFVREHLSEEECPATFTLGSKLPRNSMGKLTDWRQEDKDEQKTWKKNNILD